MYEYKDPEFPTGLDENNTKDVCKKCGAINSFTGIILPSGKKYCENCNATEEYKKSKTELKENKNDFEKKLIFLLDKLSELYKYDYKYIEDYQKDIGHIKSKILDMFRKVQNKE